MIVQAPIQNCDLSLIHVRQLSTVIFIEQRSHLLDIEVIDDNIAVLRNPVMSERVNLDTLGMGDSFVVLSCLESEPGRSLTSSERRIVFINTQPDTTSRVFQWARSGRIGLTADGMNHIIAELGTFDPDIITIEKIMEHKPAMRYFENITRLCELLQKLVRSDIHVAGKIRSNDRGWVWLD